MTLGQIIVDEISVCKMTIGKMTLNCKTIRNRCLCGMNVIIITLSELTIAKMSVQMAIDEVTMF
jgi:hypothetical protein